ncbi:MAG: type I glutamate--ammonia ligase [Legionellales bacterium]|nr:type I glutamate--ammonia ligase [Legionellales bacterium]
MSSSALNDVLALVKQVEAKFADLRFTDTLGKEQHVTLPATLVDEELLQHGKMFDGSSVKGWQGIHQSDLLLLPDPSTVLVDPFCDDTTIILRCDVIDPGTQQPYRRDPRSLAKRAEAYLRSTGIADTFYCGPEPEFFIFDDVRWKVDLSGAFYKVDSEEAAWNSDKIIEGGNIGHRPAVKGGYFPVPPVDSAHDIRSAICLHLENLGIEVEAHHHEVATSNQNEVSTKFNSLVRKADEVLVMKYVIHNVAHLYGKTATFMPKPIVGDNGSGMHCHQSLAKEGRNIFQGDEYAGLSKEALYYIGGIIKHAKALNAFTNPSTNSYKRLVPGFEAPVLLAYSACNRSASIRIPHVNTPQAVRLEVRFPDTLANPYLAFSAMMLAGLDGIRNQIEPGAAIDKNLYELPASELQQVQTVCASLAEALDHLDQDREFLLQGDVFSDDLIDSYINVKQEEVTKLRMATHPIEFEMYYSQ